MTEEGYQGWVNYPTWACALWLDNDHASYTEVRDLIERGKEAGASKFEMADHLRDMVEETRPDADASVWLDLESWAFQQIDWEEIVEHVLSE